jgi:hypothetical protein
MRYLLAFVEGEHEEMTRAAAAYNEWISGCGFPAKLPDGREVYRLAFRSQCTYAALKSAVGAGDDAVYMTPQQLIDALGVSEGALRMLKSPPESMGLKERLRAALHAHSGCCLDNDEEVDMVLAAIHEAAMAGETN